MKLESEVDKLLGKSLDPHQKRVEFEYSKEMKFKTLQYQFNETRDREKQLEQELNKVHQENLVKILLILEFTFIEIAI